MVDVGSVSFAIPVDVLPTLPHRRYNNLVLDEAPRGWTYERASQPVKFELVTLII
jgi:hypothetical protein